MGANAILQMAIIWRGQILAYRIFPRRRKITVGTSKRATFITPTLGGQAKFVLLTPRRDGDGYILHLSPELRGDLQVAGSAMSVREITSSEVDLDRGDRARLLFDGSDVRVEIRWVDPPEALPRPPVRDPELVQTMVGTGLVLGLLTALLLVLWDKTPPRPPLALSADRLTKIHATEALAFEKKQVAKREEKEKTEEKSKEKEGQTKRAKEKAGKLGRADALEKDTVIPKGKEDVLREKVQKVGILSVIGRDKAPGSGLSKLFAQSNDVEQALNGMTGAKLAVGRGAGGLSTSGAGAGGGGAGYGHIYGAGSLDTGGRGGKGHGRGPKLAERGEHEVSVALGAGGGETDGSLSKEQVYKVVKAHMAGVKYCYEKELQHKPSLGGGVDMFWVIQPDGTVGKANVKKSTMGDAAVEGCILRQVKQWQFPKAPGQTTVNPFPFVFKGG